MKRILKLSFLALASVFYLTACNNNDGSSIPKGDPAIVHGDSSGSGPSSSPTKLGTGASDVPGGTPTPNPDTGASKQNRVNSDTMPGKSKAHKIP